MASPSCYIQVFYLESCSQPSLASSLPSHFALVEGQEEDGDRDYAGDEKSDPETMVIVTRTTA